MQIGDNPIVVLRNRDGGWRHSRGGRRGQAKRDNGAGEKATLLSAQRVDALGYHPVPGLRAQTATASVAVWIAPASGTVPMLIASAVRMPAKVTNSAQGSSTFHRICQPVMPVPRAASIRRSRIVTRCSSAVACA